MTASTMNAGKEKRAPPGWKCPARRVFSSHESMKEQGTRATSIFEERPRDSPLRVVRQGSDQGLVQPVPARRRCGMWPECRRPGADGAWLCGPPSSRADRSCPTRRSRTWSGARRRGPPGRDRGQGSRPRGRGDRRPCCPAGSIGLRWRHPVRSRGRGRTADGPRRDLGRRY